MIEVKEMTPVEEIVWNLREADRLENLAGSYTVKADQHRWKAAELIAAELESTTVRDLAEQIDRSPTDTHYMAEAYKIASVHLGEQERSFDSFYQEAKIAKKDRGSAPPKTRIREGVDPTSTAPVSVNLRVTTNPADYNRFKTEAKARGVSVPEFIGMQIANVAPAPHQLSETEFIADPYAPTLDACGPDDGFKDVVDNLAKRLYAVTHNPLLTNDQRIVLANMLSTFLNYLEAKTP